jgi:glycosyltransferase involved in cell wall biosynthesis
MNAMKILYFSFVELDIPNACQTHTLGVLTGFSNNSCKVDAIVPRPKNVRPKVSGVRFYYLWPWRFSALGKLWIKILGGAFFFMLCLLKKYDAIYVRELEVNPFPRWCSIIFQIPLYIEINSILIQNMRISGMDRTRILKAEKHQAADFRQAAGLIVPSFPRCCWIIDYYGLKPDKVHMILNGTDTLSDKKIERSKALKRLNLPENGFYLGFLGNIWEYYDLSNILKAMKLCQEEVPTLYMIMIGSGPETDKLRSMSQEMNLTSRLIFLGYVQSESLFEIMGAIDVGLMVLTKKGVQDGGPIPTRFATYAAFEMPVIANDVYIEDYPKELRDGLSLVSPEDSQALADAILWLCRHPKEREKKAKILHDFVVKKLTWDSVAGEILEIIKRDKKV